MLQQTHTLFWNLFSAVLMATSSISEQVRQSPQANCKSELAAFSLDLSWVDSSPLWSMLSSLLCSSVLPEAPMLLLGISSGDSDGSPLPCGVLCTLLTSTSDVLAGDLLPGQSSGALLGSNPALCAGDRWGTQQVNALLGVPNKGNVWHGKRWSLSLALRAAHRGWGLWAPGLWSSGSHRGLHSSFHSGSQWLTHVTFGKSTRIGSGGDAPGK